MVTSSSLLKEFSLQMKSKGLMILVSIRMIIGWVGILASLLNIGKPTFYIASGIAFYFLATSIYGRYQIKRILISELRNGLVIPFLVVDYFVILLGFYSAILSYPSGFTAVPIQNSIFFSIFFLYQLYIGFFLQQKFSAIMGVVVILGYMGGIGIAHANGAELFTEYRFIPQSPGRIILSIEILKVILLLAKTVCIVKLVSFLLDILENNNQTLADELNQRETSLLKNDRLVTLGNLAANVAHEINNPLAGIKSMNEFLLEEEIYFLNRKDPLWLEKEKQILWLYRNRIEKREDHDLILNLYSYLPKKDRDYLAERCVDLGVDHRSFEGLSEDNRKEWDFVFLWLKYKTMEKANLLVSNAIDRTEKVVATFKQFSQPFLDRDQNVVRVGEGIRDILLLYNHYWESGRTLSTEIDDSLTAFLCEPAMKLVWSHLIYNAIQATNQTAGKVKVQVKRTAENEIEVSIFDNGVGILSEWKESIFHPFFTTKEKGEGIGLGLFISKEIVEKQGGRLQFESHPQETVFRVYLPVA